MVPGTQLNKHHKRKLIILCPARLTDPDSAYVVDLSTESQCGQDVDYREENPERHISVNLK